ncbi:hypothetical protein GGI43DRAFT_316827 [Trichoderma evansii]
MTMQRLRGGSSHTYFVEKTTSSAEMPAWLSPMARDGDPGRSRRFGGNFGHVFPLAASRTKACCKLAPEPRKPLGRHISILHTSSTRLGAWSRTISAYGYLFSVHCGSRVLRFWQPSSIRTHCLIDNHVLCQFVRGPLWTACLYGPHRSFLAHPRATSCWCAVLPEADAEAPANTSVARRTWGGGWIPVLTWAATFVIKFCEANREKN